MRIAFIEVLKEVSALFSWNREMGVQYLDISEEALRIINGWDAKKISASPSHRDSSLPNSDNKHKPSAPVTAKNPKSAKPVPVDPVNNLNGATGITAECDVTIHLDGDLNSQIFFMGEAFSYTSPTGELFLNILKAMNLKSDTICLCTFQPLDYKGGIPKVRQQITNIREQTEQFLNDVRVRTNGLYPQIISTLGDSALKIMMGIEYMLTTSRGKFHNCNEIRLMPTYHPSQILTDKGLKRLVWEDMKQIMSIMRLVL